MTGTFQRFAGICAYVVGIGGILYSAAFVVYVKAGSKAAATASWLLLMLGGLVTIVVAVALYLRLRESDQGFAMVGLLFGLAGGLGAALHGGFDLARIIHPAGTRVDVPNYVDPRGLLTFGLAGLAILVFSWLIRRGGGGLPRGLGRLGYLLGILLVLTYLGRLVLLDPNNPALLVVAALAGLVANPVWYVWLGRALRRS
jgi:hypothetical protein